MQEIEIPFGKEQLNLTLPDSFDILGMKSPDPLSEPELQIRRVLDNPIDSPPLRTIVREKMSRSQDPSAVIVISDNTRPVPYKGSQGILWPLIEVLLGEGIQKEQITILIATGMHRGLREDELREMLDERVFSSDIKVVNHDCRDAEHLSYLGTTSRGSEIYIDSRYIDSDIKILTGLVESHFMAGASGGRKSICPGLIGEKSTFVFHGAEMMADPKSTDLLLSGNPCHEEAFEVASAAGSDFIINVTLDHDFSITGVFAGDLKGAHEAAVDHLKSYTGINCEKNYDIVLTHAGFVGINHYQAAKAGTAAARILKPDGYLLMLADNSDSDRIGSLEYRTVLQLLKLIGPDACERMLLSEDWTFIPEQWQVQMWIRLFRKVPFDHFFYYSPQFENEDYRVIPGTPLEQLLNEAEKSSLDRDALSMGLTRAVQTLCRRDFNKKQPKMAFLKDGPYGIPL